ncbi:MAG: hypothetical protein NVSMB4_14010 [Acidimicrobiales bacterium]
MTARRVFGRLGRRGTVLLIIGGMWLLIGASIPSDPTRSAYYPELIHLLIPDPIRVGLWVLTGLVAILSAWRKPGWSDALGFSALVVMPTVRCLSYAWGWIVGALDLTGGHPGIARDGISALVWAAAAVLIITISGWRETREHDESVPYGN